jgi:hypothetical protein
MCQLCYSIDTGLMTPQEIARAYKDLIAANKDHYDDIFNKLQEKGQLADVLKELDKERKDVD